MGIDDDVMDEILVITQTEMTIDDRCLSLDLSERPRPPSDKSGFNGTLLVLGICKEILLAQAYVTP